MYEHKMIKGDNFVMMDSKDYENMVMFRVMDLEFEKDFQKSKRNFLLSLVPLSMLIGATIASKIR